MLTTPTTVTSLTATPSFTSATGVPATTTSEMSTGEVDNDILELILERMGNSQLSVKFERIFLRFVASSSPSPSSYPFLRVRKHMLIMPSFTGPVAPATVYPIPTERRRWMEVPDAREDGGGGIEVIIHNSLTIIFAFLLSLGSFIALFHFRFLFARSSIIANFLTMFSD